LIRTRLLESRFRRCIEVRITTSADNVVLVDIDISLVVVKVALRR